MKNLSILYALFLIVLCCAQDYDVLSLSKKRRPLHMCDCSTDVCEFKGVVKRDPTKFTLPLDFEGCKGWPSLHVSYDIDVVDRRTPNETMYCTSFTDSISVIATNWYVNIAELLQVKNWDAWSSTIDCSALMVPVNSSGAHISGGCSPTYNRYVSIYWDYDVDGVVDPAVEVTYSIVFQRYESHYFYAFLISGLIASLVWVVVIWFRKCYFSGKGVSIFGIPLLEKEARVLNSKYPSEIHIGPEIAGLKYDAWSARLPLISRAVMFFVSIALFMAALYDAQLSESGEFGRNSYEFYVSSTLFAMLMIPLWACFAEMFSNEAFLSSLGCFIKHGVLLELNDNYWFHSSGFNWSVCYSVLVAAVMWFFPGVTRGEWITVVSSSLVFIKFAYDLLNMSDVVSMSTIAHEIPTNDVIFIPFRVVRAYVFDRFCFLRDCGQKHSALLGVAFNRTSRMRKADIRRMKDLGFEYNFDHFSMWYNQNAKRVMTALDQQLHRPQTLSTLGSTFCPMLSSNSANVLRWHHWLQPEHLELILEGPQSPTSPGYHVPSYEEPKEPLISTCGNEDANKEYGAIVPQ